VRGRRVTIHLGLDTDATSAPGGMARVERASNSRDRVAVARHFLRGVIAHMDCQSLLAVVTQVAPAHGDLLTTDVGTVVGRNREDEWCALVLVETTCLGDTARMRHHQDIPAAGEPANGFHRGGAHLNATCSRREDLGHWDPLELHARNIVNAAAAEVGPLNCHDVPTAEGPLPWRDSRNAATDVALCLHEQVLIVLTLLRLEQEDDSAARAHR